MCGRYELRSEKQRIAEIFQIHSALEEVYFDPATDISPGSVQPVIFTNDDGDRQLELMRWGFKLPDRLLFNARSEGIDTAKFWRERFRTKRCIIPANAFFEWAKVPKGRKPKYEFTVPARELFGMAGVWSSWKNPRTEEWEDTFAILTGDANHVMQPVHNRQPIIVAPEQYAEYLTPTDSPPVHLLHPLPDEQLKSRRVSADSLTPQQTSLFDSQ